MSLIILRAVENHHLLSNNGNTGITTAVVYVLLLSYIFFYFTHIHVFCGLCTWREKRSGQYWWCVFNCEPLKRIVCGYKITEGTFKRVIIMLLFSFVPNFVLFRTLCCIFSSFERKRESREMQLMQLYIHRDGV